MFKTIKTNKKHCSRPEKAVQAPYSESGKPSEDGYLSPNKKNDLALDAKLNPNYALTKQLHAATESVRQLQEERITQAQKISELQLLLVSEMDRNARFKYQANKMQYNMDNKELFLGPQATDDDILCDFRSILDEVRTWSIKFAYDSQISLKTLPPRVATAFRNLAPGCPDLRRLLSNRKDRRLFVRGWVSLCMADFLFQCLPSDNHPGSCCEDPWLEKDIAHDVSMIENKLLRADRKAVSHRALNDWRALTTTLLSTLDSSSSTTEAVQTYIKSCGQYILTPIAGWSKETNQQKLEDELLGIIFRALRLSQKLRCQRACWSVRHLASTMSDLPDPQQSRPPVMFDLEAMRDINEDDRIDEPGSENAFGTVVELVITPGLFKRGNTGGQGFEIESSVMRSDVKLQVL